MAVAGPPSVFCEFPPRGLIGPGEVLRQAIQDNRQHHAGGGGEKGPPPAADFLILHVEESQDAKQDGRNSSRGQEAAENGMHRIFAAPSLSPSPDRY